MASRRHEHIHPPVARLNEVGTIAGFLGFAIAMFALGRAGRGGEDCCPKLNQANLELAVCQNRTLLTATGAQSATSAGYYT